MQPQPLNIRRPTFLSPTQRSIWKQNTSEYYLKYLAPNKPPNMPQTEPMSVGSAFDAKIKTYLAQVIWGRIPPEFEFDTIFEKQVEPHNRDFAIEAGRHVYAAYHRSGFLDRCVTLLSKATTEPRMEADRKSGTITAPNYEGESPVLYGIADLAFFVGDYGVVLDWKVNGYCAKSPASPMTGYKWIADGFGSSRGSGKAHNDYMPAFAGSIEYGIDPYLEQRKADWAAQLATYAWLEGISVGAPFCAIIDQIICNNRDQLNGMPQIRVAQHRSQITDVFQHNVYKDYHEQWQIVQSDWIFRDVSPEESIERCFKLNDQADMENSEDKNTAWMGRLMRKTRR